MTAKVIHHVDPARLAPGVWPPEANKEFGEGDIAASYSADRIGMGQPIRKPFLWRGSLWINVGSARFRGLHTVEAYRVIPSESHEGQSFTYAEKTCDGDAARSDPNGFYHGIRVHRGGKTYVLIGPPAVFQPSPRPAMQLELFGPS